MQYRDLLPQHQGGSFIASHIVIPNGGPVPDWVHHHGVRFQTIFCVRGWVRVVYEDQGPPFVLPDSVRTYAAAYRPSRTRSADQIEVWPTTLTIGQALPVLPLALRNAVTVPVDLDGSYNEACQRSRLG